MFNYFNKVYEFFFAIKRAYMLLKRVPLQRVFTILQMEFTILKRMFTIFHRKFTILQRMYTILQRVFTSLQRVFTISKGSLEKFSKIKIFRAIFERSPNDIRNISNRTPTNLWKFWTNFKILLIFENSKLLNPKFEKFDIRKWVLISDF